MIVVPPTLQPDGYEATSSTDEQFLDLLLADEDLLGRSSTRSSRNGRGRHRAGRAEAPAPSDVPARHGDAARERCGIAGVATPPTDRRLAATLTSARDRWTTDDKKGR